MTAIVIKESLIKSLVDIRNPIINRDFDAQRDSGFSIKDDPIVEVCNSLIADLELMFGYTSNSSKWTHIEDLSKESPFDTMLGVDIVAKKDISDFLFERAESYFSQNLVQTDELDWFLLDFIIAVNYRVQIKKLSDEDFEMSYPKLWKAINKFDGDNYIVLVLFILGKLLKTGILFFIVFGLFMIGSEGYQFLSFLGFSLIAFKFYGWYAQMRKFSRLSSVSKEKIKKLQNLYSLFSNGLIRWNLLIEDIKNLRQLGVEFPLAIDSAITNRILIR